VTQPEALRAAYSSQVLWRGADTERRYEAACRPRAASGASAAAGGGLSLDDCTYDAWIPTDTGEWHVQQTVVDDYCEFVAVEDTDGTLLRRPKRKEKNSARVDFEVGEGTFSTESKCVEDGLDLLVEKRAIASRRAKRNLKWKVLALRGDRIVTLTTRGGIPFFDEGWRLWGKLERYCWRRYRSFEYVVVMEKHKSGAFHIHFVTNKFMDANMLRLLWHRVLTGDHSLRSPLRGADSPGNVDVSRVLRSRKICGYLAKYLGKTFDCLYGKRVKRFAASKGIADPERTRSRMHARMGEHVYRLREVAESLGWRLDDLYEGSVAGRRLVWLRCVRSRAGPVGSGEL
jgi:hypothetical protein